MALGGNLNASAAVGDSATTQLSLYDSLGREQVLDITLTKTGDNAWSWAAQDNGGAALGGGNVTFDANGLTSAAPQTPIQIERLGTAAGDETDRRVAVEWKRQVHQAVVDHGGQRRAGEPGRQISRDGPDAGAGGDGATRAVW
jgi:hypothetical protein